jgi:hypothetical protein
MAAQQALPATGTLAQADSNRDGLISEQEAQSFLNELKTKNPTTYAELEALQKKGGGGQPQGQVTARSVGGPGSANSSGGSALVGFELDWPHFHLHKITYTLFHRNRECWARCWPCSPAV